MVGGGWGSDWGSDWGGRGGTNRSLQAEELFTHFRGRPGNSGALWGRGGVGKPSRLGRWVVWLGGDS